jgi:hypothetical protein
MKIEPHAKTQRKDKIQNCREKTQNAQKKRPTQNNLLLPTETVTLFQNLCDLPLLAVKKAR